MKKLLISLGLFLLPIMMVNNPNIYGAEIKNTPTIIRSNLKLGSQGAEVSELQAALKLLGYYTGPVDGIFSENTAKAVAQFQSAVGLQADGVVGGETWKNLFPSSAQTVGKFNSSAVVTQNQTTNQGKPTVKTTSKSNSNPANNPQKIKPKTTTTVSSNTKPKTSNDLPVLRLGSQGEAVERLQKRLKVLGFFSNAVTGYFGTSTETAVKAAQTKFKMTPDGIVGGETWRVLLR